MARTIVYLDRKVRNRDQVKADIEADLATKELVERDETGAEVKRRPFPTKVAPEPEPEPKPVGR